MLNDPTCFKQVYIVCGYTCVRSGIDTLTYLICHIYTFSEYDKNSTQSPASSQNRAFPGKLRRNKTMIKILFVCHGNICRSTMAQYVLQHMVEQEGIAWQFYIDSAATSYEEIGNPVHPGTRNKLNLEGIYCGNHRARRMTKQDYEDFDYIIGMDTANKKNIMRIIGRDKDNKVYKLLTFANDSADIADPWYTGNFDITYSDVVRGCRGFLEYLQQKS